MRVTSYLRERVNQGVCDAFVIKWNIGQLNCYSVPVRMKYWNYFVADKKMKRRLELEDRFLSKQTFPFLQYRCVWSGLHTCEQWAYKVGDHCGCRGSLVTVTLRQTKQALKYRASQHFITDKPPFSAFQSWPEACRCTNATRPSLLKAHMSSWSHTSAPAVNLCLKSRQIIIHMLFFPPALPLFFSLLPLSHSHSR